MNQTYSRLLVYRKWIINNFCLLYKLLPARLLSRLALSNASVSIAEAFAIVLIELQTVWSAPACFLIVKATAVAMELY